MTALRKSIQNALAVLILVELKYSVELRFAFSKGPYFYSHNCHILLTISEKKRILKQSFGIHKDIFACLFSIHNTIGLSRHEQVCLSGLRFERYFSHHRADDGRSISRNVAHLNILVHDVINLLYYKVLED